MYLKNIATTALLVLILAQSTYSYSEIRAENNAYRHNNKGLIYLQEKYYFGAIKEFQIAIDLMPDAQGSAVYYVNLAMTYEKIGYPQLAVPNYEKAVKLHPLYFDYYLRLAECYNRLGVAEIKLNEYKTKDYNSLNNIMIGLLYIQTGEVSTGITLLDEFCNDEKDLLITEGVRKYIKHTVNKL